MLQKKTDRTAGTAAALPLGGDDRLHDPGARIALVLVGLSGLVGLVLIAERER